MVACHNPSQIIVCCLAACRNPSAPRVCHMAACRNPSAPRVCRLAACHFPPPKLEVGTQLCRLDACHFPPYPKEVVRIITDFDLDGSQIRPVDHCYLARVNNRVSAVLQKTKSPFLVVYRLFTGFCKKSQLARDTCYSSGDKFALLL